MFAWFVAVIILLVRDVMGFHFQVSSRMFVEFAEVMAQHVVKKNFVTRERAVRLAIK